MKRSLVEVNTLFKDFEYSLTQLIGKTIREGMGQATNRSSVETLDLVITNALIIDWSGIYKVMIYILSQHLRLSLMLHNRQTLVSKMA